MTAMKTKNLVSLLVSKTTLSSGSAVLSDGLKRRKNILNVIIKANYWK